MDQSLTSRFYSDMFDKNPTISVLYACLLLRLDDLLSDEHVLSQDEAAAILLHDALLKLKLWGTDIELEKTSVLRHIQAHNKDMTDIVQYSLQDVARSLQKVEEADTDKGGTGGLSADMELTTGSPRVIALHELETTVERLADLAEPIMTYWEMISEEGFRAVTRKALVEHESVVQRDIEEGQMEDGNPAKVVPLGLRSPVPVIDDLLGQSVLKALVEHESVVQRDIEEGQMEDGNPAKVVPLGLRSPVPVIDDLLGQSVFYEERRGDYSRARKATDAACAEARLNNDNTRLVPSLIACGIVHQLQGDINVASSCLEEAVKLARGTPELRYRALVYLSEIPSLNYDYFPDGGCAGVRDTQPHFDSVANLKTWIDRMSEVRTSVNDEALLLEGRMVRQRRIHMRARRIGADLKDATGLNPFIVWASVLQDDCDWFEREKADARNLAALDLLLGDVFLKADDLPKALEKVEKAGQTYCVLQDSIGEANSASKIGDFLVAPVSNPDVWNTFLTEGSSDNSLHWRIEASEADITALNVPEARTNYKKASTLYSTGNSTRGLARIEMRLGYLDVLEARSTLDPEGCYHRAKKHVRKASKLFEQGEDWYGYHLSLAQLALCRIGCGELTEDQNLTIEVGEWGQLSGSFSYSLGIGLFISRVGRNWLVRSGDYERALACFRLAESCFSALGAPLAYVQSIKDQMNVYEMLGDSSGFVRMTERALDGCQALARNAPARKSQASTEANWIIVQSLTFATKKAVPDLMKQIRKRVHPEHDDGSGIFADLSQEDSDNLNQGFLMEMMKEEFDRRSQDVTRVLNAAHLSNSAMSTMSTDSTNVPVMQTIKTFDDVPVTEHAKLSFRQSLFWEHLYRGKQARRLADREQAGKSFAKARQIARTSNAFRKSFMDASVNAYEGHTEKAVESFKRYLEEEYRSSQILAPIPVLQLDKLRKIAGLALNFFCEMEAFPDAQAYLDVIVQRSGKDWWKLEEHPWESLRLIAMVEEGTGQLTQALNTLENAMDAFEQRRQRLSVDQLKLAFAGNSTMQSIYFKATRVALKLREQAHEQGKEREFDTAAFDALERGKARSLLDLMASGAISRSEEHSADVTVRRWRRLGAFLASRGGLLQRELSERVPNADNVARLKKEILDTEEELHLVEAQITTARSPAFSRTADVLRLVDLVAKLNDTTAILQYVFSPYELISWAITSKGMVQSKRIPMDYYQLDQRINVFYDNCRSGKAFSDEAEWLAEVLLKPFDDIILSCSKLLIVPYGSLHLLPFQALLWRDQPLGITHAMSYLPSASAMAYMKPLETLNSVKGVLAIGNPSNMDGRPLPGSETEADAIAQWMPNSKSLTGPNATYEKVLEEIHNYSILHFATHCNLLADVPLLSSVLLADKKALTVCELMDLHLDADLIVLNVCQTGRGEPIAGDDVVGLSRALLAAGARAVVVSLWPVSDVARCLLLINFYQRLRDSEPLAQALQGAQKYLRQCPEGGQDDPSIMKSFHDELVRLHASESTIKQALAKLREFQDQDSKVAKDRDVKVQTGKSSTRDSELDSQHEESPAVRDYSHPKFWAPFILIGAQ